MNKDSLASMSSRRKFLGMTGLSAAALAISPRFAFAEATRTADRKIHIGIIGGGFGTGFFFHEHPNCVVEAVSDLRADRRELLMKTYKCTKSYPSLEKLILDPKIDAVFIATPAPDHHRHVTAALNAGKHVLCAVPCMECHRFFDLQRYDNGTGYMADVLNAYIQHETHIDGYHFDYMNGAKFIKGKNEIYAIPQDQIDLSTSDSGTVLIQNPGY